MGQQNSTREQEDESAGVVPGVYTEPFFYGRITRQEAEEILKMKGMTTGLYLLRESITPMGNFTLSIVNDGEYLHYHIEKQVDGKYKIAQGEPFSDPVELIKHYKQQHVKGVQFSCVPKTPCLRFPTQQAIAFRGLSYNDLHGLMKEAAWRNKADMATVFGPKRDALLLHVLKTAHENMPWFHGQIGREEGNKRLAEDGHSDGKFLVRSRSKQESLVLSLSFENNFRHYVILLNDGESYQIEKASEKFKALIILVDHYHNKRDGLPCRLTAPIPRPDIHPEKWEYYKELNRNLTKKYTSYDYNGASACAAPKNMAPHPPLQQTDEFGSDQATGGAGPNMLWKDKQFDDVAEEEEEEEPVIDSSRTVTHEEGEKQESIYRNIRDVIKMNQLRPEDVVVTGKLGEGQFGEVKKGWCRLNGQKVPVAVKMIKSDNPDAQSEMMKEAEVMKDLDHQHIVRFIGVCKRDTLMIVLELAENGSLSHYLKKLRKHGSMMKTWHQLELASQICEGMIYLDTKGVVHRDLATRNVLLVTEHFAKISDFGLSRMVDSDEYYTAHGPGRWPLMWYAPECLYFHRFDCKSDVWSFGVTLWEIMSYGLRPYHGTGMKPPQVLGFLENGLRMAKPAYCDDSIYHVMLSCWEFEKRDRPTFQELLPKLARCLSLSKEKKKKNGLLKSYSQA